MPTLLWTPTPDLDHTVEEFDHDFERLRKAAEATPEQRSALHGCMAALYRMREYRGSTFTNSTAYFVALGTVIASSAGPEGVITARGTLEHVVVNAPTPETQSAYPGDNVFPGEYTYPGANLQWRDESDPRVGSANFDPDQLARYRAIAGRPVLETLQVTRDFNSGV